jgi:hypothetical protein
MANNTSSIGAEALLRLISLKREEVLALMLKYGVRPAYSINGNTDVDIAYFATKLAKKSHSFSNKLMQLMANDQVLTSLYSSMDGYSNAGGFATDYSKDLFGGGSSSTSSTGLDCTKAENKNLLLCGGKGETKDKPKKDTSWLTDALNLAQTGFNGYLQLDDNKTKRALADASVKVSESGGYLGGNTDLTPKSNTGLYVGLGILGISVIGLIVYLATKKKA